PAAARNQTGTFQLPGSIRDGWPLDTQHFGEEILSNWQCVLVTAVTHHEQPTCQPLLEAVCTVARHRPHGPRERRARHLGCASGNLDEKPGGGTLGTEDGYHTRETLPPGRCHLNDTAVRLNRHH